MSKNANWSYTAICTHWKRLESNKTSTAQYDSPVTFMCSFNQGGSTEIDDSGSEFTPAFTLYTEKNDISRGDYIGFGDLSDTESPIDSKNAKIVRRIIIYDESLFNDVPDFRISSANEA